jgi:hypothetical protein
MVSEMKTGRILSSAATGPFQPQVTEFQLHSGSAGPVWIFALES